MMMEEEIEHEIAPSEVEFLAQDEMIQIVPTFATEEMTFVGGTYGPFSPLEPVTVPLWLAMALKKAKMCKITVPEWMRLGRGKHSLNDFNFASQFGS